LIRVGLVNLGSDRACREVHPRWSYADALAEPLLRHGAGAFTADWAALLTAIKEKAAKLTS